MVWLLVKSVTKTLEGRAWVNPQEQGGSPSWPISGLCGHQWAGGQGLQAQLWVGGWIWAHSSSLFI